MHVTGRLDVLETKQVPASVHVAASFLHFALALVQHRQFLRV